MASPLTTLLERWQAGDEAAADELFERVYPDLRVIVAGRLRQASDQHLLQTTELANEVYLKLTRQKRAPWANREQFFAIAARIARRAVIDYIRHQKRQKRGAGWKRVTLSDIPDSEDAITDVLALNECLDQLAEIDQLAARVVEMRYFGDLSIEEVARGLSVSVRTVARRWRFARAWLKQCLGTSDSPSERT